MNQTIEKKKQDRRCRKTMESIKNALLLMLAEQPLSNISISQLAENADINRKTFYNHYSSLQEVLADIEDELSESVFDMLKEEDFLEEMTTPRHFFTSISKRLKDQEHIYRILIRSGIDAEIFTKINERTKEYFYEMFSKRLPLDYNTFQFYLNVIMAQIASSYKEWFCSDSPSITLDQLSDFICNQVFTACQYITSLDIGKTQ